MLLMRHVLLFVLAFYFDAVAGDDPSDLGHNYSRVFKEMPVLLERIMEMLQEKPEVLEKDDITTFHDTLANQLSQFHEAKLDKRETGEHDFYENFDDFDDSKADGEYDVYLLKASDDFEGFTGVVGPDVFKLISADEMVETMLMIERKLEEDNHDND